MTDAEGKAKFFSACIYILALTNGGLGSFVTKRVFNLAQWSDVYGGWLLLYTSVPLLVLWITAILPLTLRKKDKLLPALLLAATGTLFFTFCLMSGKLPDTDSF
ncbi:MAG: hypothetical protein ACAH80_13785 [Alphaproteobacteria bacterium]